MLTGFLFACLNVSATDEAQDASIAQACESARVTSWVVPPTPNGLIPNQNWLSIAASPDGDVFITGSDHKTNAALYRLNPSTRKLAYAGDARSASEAVHNWLPSETAEKFHMKPIFYRGLVYLATADYTDSDAGYLKRRGFHWYCYDPDANLMRDLSANEPNGVGGAHASIVAATLDEERGLIYAISTPTCELYRYDIAANHTENLGKAACVPAGFHMPGRYIWMGQGGRVYFTVSSSDHVLYYDPKTGFGERTDWKLASQNGASKVTRTGAEVKSLGQAYMADEAGRIYRYDRRKDSFAQIGLATTNDSDYRCGSGLKMRAFNVTANGKTLYFINDGAAVSAFWKWDAATGRTEKLCDLSELDATIGKSDYSIHGGNDSWGNDGSLYFCSFGDSKTHPTELILSRVSPEMIKELERHQSAIDTPLTK